MILGFGRARNETRAKAPFFARSLTLVPRSLLLNRTETLATQARYAQKLCSAFHRINHPILIHVLEIPKKKARFGVFFKGFCYCFIFIPLSTTINSQVFLLFSKKNLVTKQGILLYLG